MSYTPDDWYWIVGGDDTRFFSSLARGYVDTLPESAGVTGIDTEEEIWGVLARQAPQCLPDDKRHYRPVMAWQFHAQLNIAGLAGNLEAVLSGLPAADQAKARARLEFSSTYSRFDPLVSQLGAAMGMSSDDLDALWQAAAQL